MGLFVPFYAPLLYCLPDTGLVTEEEGRSGKKLEVAEGRGAGVSVCGSPGRENNSERAVRGKTKDELYERAHSKQCQEAPRSKLEYLSYVDSQGGCSEAEEDGRRQVLQEPDVV